VIQDFRDRVNGIAWIEASGVSYLVAGCGDGVVGAWQVQHGEDHCDTSLRWMTTKGVFDVKDATIQDVQGLSHLNRQLLTQREAVGEPAHRLREASKKLTTMASVVSNLKASSNTTVEPALTVSTLVEQLMQWLQQAQDPLCQDIVAAIVKTIDGYK
jgi:hypothetical protein